MRTVVDETLKEKVTVREGNRSRSVTNLHAMILRMTNDAVSGNAKAQSNLIALARSLGLIGEPHEVTNSAPFTADDLAMIVGPYQFPEKFIPLMIINGLEGRPMPIYGHGEHIRDWLFVEDHARALSTILRAGRIGEYYNVGGDNEMRNIDVARMICDLLDAVARPLPGRASRRELITFVADRPGHDARYALDARKIREELAWRPQGNFAAALRRTVEWYLANKAWWQPLRAVTMQRFGLLDSCP